MQNKIKQAFTQSIQTQILSAEMLSESLSAAATVLSQSLINGGKILLCGNGSAAAETQRMAAKLINRFEKQRPGLPAIDLTANGVMLTAISSDFDYSEIYSKQIRALGKAEDVLIVFSSSGNSKNIIKALEAAELRALKVIALTGKDGGEIAQRLGSNDIELRAPSHRSARIQESHQFLANCLCELVDHALFPNMEE